jgi:hypothetical protein
MGMEVEAVGPEQGVVLRPATAGVGGRMDADEAAAAVVEADEVRLLLRGQRRVAASEAGGVHEDEAVDALVGRR